jgi:hypothetical protein
LRDVLKGKMPARSADREEVVEAGDAFHAGLLKGGMVVLSQPGQAGDVVAVSFL